MFLEHFIYFNFERQTEKGSCHPVPPPQGVRPAGLRAPGPVLQARRAGGHEAADLRAEELEQLHLPEAGGGGQAPGLHRPHLQPDAADRHVDGLPADGEEQRAEGTDRGGVLGSLSSTGVDVESYGSGTRVEVWSSLSARVKVPGRRL